MYAKLVTVTIQIEGKPVEMTVSVSCLPTTADHEILRRARNIFLAAANNAVLKMV